MTNYRSNVLVEKQNINYDDKSQLCNRLYKHAETKTKYLQSLKALKDHVELRDCTFKPELVTGGSTTPTRESDFAFERLHQNYETMQRKKFKKGNILEQQFKENHPFHPNRVTKGNRFE